MATAQFVKARVSASTKDRLRVLAERQGLSESAVLKRLLDVAVLGLVDSSSLHAGASAPRRTSRLYVRLNADDQRFLDERAAARGLRAATYVALLVRAHLRSAAPIPKAELTAMARSIAELSALGRNLNQYVRAVHAGERATGFTAEHARTLLTICEALRDHQKAVLLANERSWRGEVVHGPS